MGSGGSTANPSMAFIREASLPIDGEFEDLEADAMVAGVKEKKVERPMTNEEKKEEKARIKAEKKEEKRKSKEATKQAKEEAKRMKKGQESTRLHLLPAVAFLAAGERAKKGSKEEGGTAKKEENGGVKGECGATGPCLLFDLDGTLTHTDALHFQAFNKALQQLHGRSMDLVYYSTYVHGCSNAAIMERLLPGRPAAEHVQMADTKEELFRGLVQKELQPLPGLLALLEWADAVRCPIGVVTNAPRANAALMLSALGLEGRFATIVIGEELTRAKPDPLPYLTGLQRLNGDLSKTVAFEDSRSGLQSAVSAGLKTVGMTTSLEGAVLLAGGAVLAAKDFADPELMALVTKITGLTKPIA